MVKKEARAAKQAARIVVIVVSGRAGDVGAIIRLCGVGRKSGERKTGVKTFIAPELPGPGACNVRTRGLMQEVKKFVSPCIRVDAEHRGGRAFCSYLYLRKVSRSCCLRSSMSTHSILSNEECYSPI